MASDNKTSEPSGPLSLEFGATIRARRRQIGLSQEELALSVGTNRRVIGRLERGIGTVRLEIALRAAHALGLSAVPRDDAER
ncbi:MAG: helix-turn-helix domain-containing protein [Solirubrobacterales bacterium]